MRPGGPDLVLFWYTFRLEERAPDSFDRLAKAVVVGQMLSKITLVAFRTLFHSEKRGAFV